MPKGVKSMLVAETYFLLQWGKGLRFCGNGVLLHLRKGYKHNSLTLFSIHRLALWLYSNENICQTVG